MFNYSKKYRLQCAPYVFSLSRTMDNRQEPWTTVKNHGHKLVKNPFLDGQLYPSATRDDRLPAITWVYRRTPHVIML